ncbi:hypothetical protein PsorP6_012677 [Peronosclerospora sorghi]|uniref:Uncharacterized protein n=1 Tax=Peronosclerospora sorghi TaxID=230839 RepID=A0ACC0WHK7_9STRA|nr:hypothetical protein PsorP6_012677 [Peronosclerospora sorghi]
MCCCRRVRLYENAAWIEILVHPARQGVFPNSSPKVKNSEKTMRIFSLPTSFTLMTLADHVNAHGFASQPRCVFNKGMYTDYVALTDASINPAFQGGIYNHAPNENCKNFADRWDATGYKTLAEMLDPLINGCGNSDDKAPPVDVSGMNEMWWQNNELKEGFLSSHCNGSGRGNTPALPSNSTGGGTPQTSYPPNGPPSNSPNGQPSSPPNGQGGRNPQTSPSPNNPESGKVSPSNGWEGGGNPAPSNGWGGGGNPAPSNGWGGGGNPAPSNGWGGGGNPAPSNGWRGGGNPSPPPNGPGGNNPQAPSYNFGGAPPGGNTPGTVVPK